MAKMWEGRNSAQTSSLADEFNSSIGVDLRMYRSDIQGSMAHAAMLAAKGIITEQEAGELIDGLQAVLTDIENKDLKIDMSCEDIHMFVEQELTERLGDVGRKLHTARSRNDQVALDIRMHLKNDIDEISDLINELCGVLADTAEKYRKVIMPGYTHLQRAQPVTFGHHLLAYAMMLLRDLDRLKDTKRRMNVSPIGCCALAGTTYKTDRRLEAELLGFDGICLNSLDGVSDRDFIIELLSDISIIMMHLSRFSEELILWSSWEFRFIELSDAFTTGSSIMPQKKNPDMAELVRGKCGRVYGDLFALLTTMKGLPLAYDRDMQEDKAPLFEALDTVQGNVIVFEAMISSAEWNLSKMEESCFGGFANATDVADYLVRKGMPFRVAHGVSAKCVRLAIDSGLSAIEELKLEDMKKISDLIEEDIFEKITPKACMEGRKTLGGPGSIDTQIETLKTFCEKYEK